MVVFGVDIRIKLRELLGDRKFKRWTSMNPEKKEEFARKFLGISVNKKNLCCKSGSHRA